MKVTVTLTARAAWWMWPVFYALLPVFLIVALFSHRWVERTIERIATKAVRVDVLTESPTRGSVKRQLLHGYQPKAGPAPASPPRKP